MQKIQKKNIIVKGANVSKNCKDNLILSKLHKVLSISAKFQVFGIFSSKIK